MRYFVWEKDSQIYASDFLNVRKVKDLEIPAGAVVVYADTEDEAITQFRLAKMRDTASGRIDKSVSLDEYDQATRDFGQARALVRTAFDSTETSSNIDKEALGWILSMTLERLDGVKPMLDRLSP